MADIPEEPFEETVRREFAPVFDLVADSRFKKELESLIYIAFVFGAAWALDDTTLRDIALAQLEAVKKRRQ